MMTDLKNKRQELHKFFSESLKINVRTHNILRNELGVISQIHESMIDLHHELTYSNSFIEIII